MEQKISTLSITAKRCCFDSAAFKLYQEYCIRIFFYVRGKTTIYLYTYRHNNLKKRQNVLPWLLIFNQKQYEVSIYSFVREINQKEP